VLLTDRDLLARLVGFDSTSSRSNLPIADFVCNYLDRSGVRVERQPGPDDTKVNVIASTGPDAGTGGLTFSGHLDVVPAEEPGWNTKPFRMAEVEQRYVGRGTSDMKGSVALAMNLLAAADPQQLRQPLALLLTFDEELGSLGAQHFARTWPTDRQLPVNVVVGEPTSLRAIRMHKGHLWMEVTIHGTAAHSGSPHLGHNAIEAAAKVVGALSRLADVFKHKRSDNSRYFSTVPFSVLNVGRITGGSAVNVIPDRCVIDLGLRLLPGMNTEAAIEWVRDAVTKADPRSRITVTIRNNNPPMLLDTDAAIHTALCEQLGQNQSFGVSFASDAGVLSELGLQCVLFGPGSIEVAHKPNEFVPIDEFNRAGVILRQLVTRFCLSREAEPAR
jgi:acetylornithine deacetylase